MTIRRLRPDDQEFLWDALYDAMYVPTGEEPPSREILRLPEISCYAAGWMQHPDDLGVIAEDGDTALGAAWLRCWRGSRRGFGFVDEATPELSISVRASHRGRGIGTAMLRRVFSAAEKQYPAVSLSVSVSNPARRLYKREGFVPVSRSEDGAMTMVKVLGR